MLVLTRKLDEQILIGDQIKITVLKIRNNQIRLGISAPRDVRVLRGELQEQEKDEQIVVEMDLDEFSSPRHLGFDATPVEESSEQSADVRPNADVGDASRQGSSGAIISGRVNPASGQMQLRTTPLGAYFTAP